jgi:hypothetical protein
VPVTTTTPDRRRHRGPRPPGFLVYMSLEERQQLHAAAATAGLSATEYVRRLVAREVRQQLEEATTSP